MNIGFYDSGLGGITTLKESMKLLPNENYYYYADNLNNPYGNKTKKELWQYVIKAIDYLIDKECKLIIVACNTISTNFMKEIKDKYNDIDFIFALPLLNDKKIINKTLLLATLATCESDYIKFLKNDNLVIHPCIRLVHLIEEGNELLIDKYLNDLHEKYKNDNIKSIIIGCTHYYLIKEKLRNIFCSIDIIDPSVGISIVLENKIKSKSKTSGMVNIYNTKEDKDYNKRCYEILTKKDIY